MPKMGGRERDDEIHFFGEKKWHKKHETRRVDDDDGAGVGCFLLFAHRCTREMLANVNQLFKSFFSVIVARHIVERHNSPQNPNVCNPRIDVF